MAICPACGEENPDRARFCLACGTALGAAEPTPAAEERKVVSVLFVDLAGFTASSDRADPEDVRARLRPYHAMLKREIERYGGTVEKFIGDAVMAVFGAPVAHEDDAERAVRAALRITEAIPELNEEHPGLELSVRAAVNTGEAVVALGARPERGEGIATGDVVNTASRLQQVAPVGGVVVGEVTHRATKEVIDYRPLEPVTVKGKEEPLRIWQAVSARSRFAVEVDRPTVELVGREDDLALLQQTYARTVREHSVQLVTITGEPGVGKSRLVAEFFGFIDDLPELVAWRQGRCLPYGEGVTFWALGEIVKAQAGILESDAPEEAIAKLAQAVGTVVEEESERDWITSRLAPLVGTSVEGAGAAEREESFTAWRAFIEAIATKSPSVLVVEDLHWADEAMLGFVEHLVDWSTGVPLLILCTSRPELYERHPGWGGGKRNSTTIGLSPLSPEETARLIAALLSETMLPADTQHALLEHSGGNPLYAEEFVRMLLDRGIIERRGHAVELATDAEIPVPDTVQAIIAARLDTLPPERKSLLHDASVVGRTFWSGALEAMGGARPDEIREILHDLSRKELVRPVRRSSVEEQAEYSFWHLLVRDVAYGQIPRSPRAEKHVAAARWIEQMVGERVPDHAELIAHHYLQALELAASSASMDAAALTSNAVRFLTMAGDRATALDMAKAYEHYARALELLALDDPARGKVCGKAGEAALFLGRLDEATRLGEEAVEELRRGGDVAALSGALIDLGRAIGVQGDTTKAMALTREAVELLEQRPPSPALAKAYASLSGRCGLAGQSEESLAAAEKAIPLCLEFGLKADLSRALQFRGYSMLLLGLGDGIEDNREAVRLSLEAGDPFASVALVNLAGLVWENEGPTPALDLYEQSIALAQRRGLYGNARWATAETTWMYYDLGRWDQLREVADEVVASDPDRSQVSFLCLPYVTFTKVWRDELDDAATMVEEMLPRCREIHDPQILLPALEAAALVAWRRGEVERAVGLIEEYERETEGRPTWRAMYLPSLVRILTATDRLADAERLIESAAEYGARRAWCLASARAVMAEGKGEESAAALYDDAAAGWSSFGHVLEHGQALLGAGRCLLELGRTAEATARLREARERFLHLGAVPLIEETDRLLERATALTS